MSFFKRHIKFLATLCLCSIFQCSSSAYAQQLLQNFGPPLTIPLLLKGTYGEIRPNHFHSGIDLKTEGRVGLPVIAIADGFVSRIKADEYGFGRVIYMTHDNGYVSVYGHLHMFCNVLDSLVFEEQKSKQKYSVELFPKKDKLRFHKGDTIAFSGNSGGSGGPHLHFEVRDARTEIPYNPLTFNFNIVDKTPPVLRRVIIYSVNDDLSQIDSLTSFVPKTLDGRNYFPVVNLQAGGKIAIGFSGYDMADNDSAILGLFSSSLTCNGKETYSYRMDNFSFDETKLVNGHIDYDAKQKGDTIYERCYLLPGNTFSQYKRNDGVGVINLDSIRQANLIFKLKDARGNEIDCSFKIVKGKLSFSKNLEEKPLKDSSKKVFLLLNKNQFKTSEITLDIPENSLYRNIDFEFSKRPAVKGMLTDVYCLNTDKEPLKKSASLSIFIGELLAAYMDKVVIVKVSDKGNYSSINASYSKGMVTGRISSFGNYAVLLDTVAPVFKDMEQKYDSIYKCNTIEVKIIDNLSGVKTYSCFVNDVWQQTEYDYKNDKLICYLRKGSEDKMKVTFEASDGKQNKAVLSRNMRVKL